MESPGKTYRSAWELKDAQVLLSIADLVLGDEQVQDKGSTKVAYGALLVQALARKDPKQALLNASTSCSPLKSVPLS